MRIITYIDEKFMVTNYDTVLTRFEIEASKHVLDNNAKMSEILLTLSKIAKEVEESNCVDNSEFLDAHSQDTISDTI